jgi:hypothetical protein
VTDRIKGFTVALDRDYRDDDAEDIRTALEMVKGVLSATPSTTNPDDWMNRDRVRREMRERILEAVWPKDEP